MYLKPVLAFSLLLSGLALDAQCPASRQTGHHIVRRGENLFRIARQHRVTVTDLCTWNHLDEHAPLSVCTDLLVSAPRERVAYTPATPDPTPNPISDQSSYRIGQHTAPAPQTYNVMAIRHLRQHGGTHLVREGETLSGLAALYGYTEQRFREMNQLDATAQATPGMALRSTDCSCPSTIIHERKPVQISTAVLRDYDEDEHLVPVSTTPKSVAVRFSHTPAHRYPCMARLEMPIIKITRTSTATDLPKICSSLPANTLPETK